LDCDILSLWLTVAPLTAAQAQDRASERSERTQRILEHWTADRIAAAETRDMVIDHRGKAFIRGKRGALRSYGHNFRPELTSDSRRVQQTFKPLW